MVIKRNLSQEPFMKGRIALAVYKAAVAHDKKISSVGARDLGAKIAQKIEEYAMASVEPSFKNPKIIELDLEWIQDEVIRSLDILGFSDISRGYSQYRISRQALRIEKQKVRLNQIVIEGSVFERDSLMQKIVNICQHSGITLSSVQLEPLLFDRYKYEKKQDFTNRILEVLFEIQQGSENWDLLLGRWFFYANIERFANLSWMDEDFKGLSTRLNVFVIEEVSNHMKIKKDQVEQVLARLPFDFLMKEGDLGFSGQQLLNKKIGHLCSVIFLIVAIRLSEGVDQAVGLFEQMLEGGIVFPLMSLRGLFKNKDTLGFERALRFEDETEAIFEGLFKVATLVKQGCSVSLDVSALRGKGVWVGKEGNVSAGLSPVMNMIGQTCLMLSGVSGEQQKARIFLECWHWDLEEFIAFGRGEQKVVRTALLISDLFMRHVMENKMWILCTPENIKGYFYAKNIKERERLILEKIEFLSNEKEDFSRLVPARTVFDWICSACAQGDGCSIVFRDLMRTYEGGVRNLLPSARLGGILSCDGEDHVLESAVVFGVDISENVKRLKLIDEAQKCWIKSKGLTKVGSGICILGVNDQGVVLKSLSSFLDQYGSHWDLQSFWGLSNPWESFKKGLYQTRSGYLETIGNAVSWNCQNGPSMGRFLLQTPREEYLWLTRQSPIWVKRDSYQYQYRLGSKKAVFGSKKSENAKIQEQAQSASDWQTITDQTLTWDVFLNEVEAQTVGESIKTAWIYGLRVVRRFVRNN